MKLVIATPLYPPEIGGPATYVRLLETGLPHKGIEVDVVKFTDVRHLPKGIRHIMYFARVLGAARSADAILALDPVSTGLPAMLAAKCAGKPFVVKIVGDYAWEQGRQRFGITETLDDFVQTTWVPSPVRLLRTVQIFVARHATRIIVPSDYLKGIVSAWDMPHKKIRVVYNAVLNEGVGEVPKSVATLPHPLSVSVGRLVPWKGMTGIIDAVALLRAGGNQMSLAIVGDGPDKTSLSAYAKRVLKSDYIFTGSLTHADTLATMQSADTFVLNSSYEGLAHILIEALALSVPIITTRVGGNPEVIQHRENGLLVSGDSSAELAETIAEACTDTRLRAHLSSCALESSKRFSPEAMLSATAAVLQSI